MMLFVILYIYIYIYIILARGLGVLLADARAAPQHLVRAAQNGTWRAGVYIISRQGKCGSTG